MKNINKMALCLLISGLLVSFTALADETPGSGLSERVKQIEEQLKEKALSGKWAEIISFSGIIKADANYEKRNFADSDIADIALSKVELGVDINIAKHVKGSLLFLYEDDNDVVLDKGFILLDGADVVPLYLKAGKLYVPFGKFRTNMISDPLTLELGETRESAVEIGFKSEGFYAAAYMFNGGCKIDKDDDTIRDYGAMLGYSSEKEGLKIDIGVGYINNLFDSKGLIDATGKETEASADKGFSVRLHKKVSAVNAYAVVKAGSFSFFGEYMTMLDDPEVDLEDIVPGTLSAMGLGSRSGSDRFAAWNIELGYTFEVEAKELTIGAAYQGVTNSEDWFPESRYMGVVSVSIFDKTSVALEYRHDEFENDDKADVLTARLAIEF
jgi:hypothetical protein